MTAMLLLLLLKIKLQHTLVNFEHVSSASLIKFARSIYLAHLEFIYRSAVSSPWASSNHLYASITSPPCCKKEKTQQ
jgi:hypothetical protein